MIRLNILETSENIIVTLSEKTTLGDDYYYLFVFEHQVTREKVKIIIPMSSDLSDYPERFNEFTINPYDLFETVGWYLYRVYQQESSTNEDEDLTDGKVENGKMYLAPDSEFSFDMNNEPTTFVVYDGR